MGNYIGKLKKQTSHTNITQRNTTDGQKWTSDQIYQRDIKHTMGDETKYILNSANIIAT